MKPLISESQDTETLQDLGRASVQIVHDLKNQLNGLKLYATFLRKRMEKAERPQDEQETIAKLINGLERAAADMTTLVRYGRPLELRRQPRADLRKIVSAAAQEAAGATPVVNLVAEESDALEGEFDGAALKEAFQAITQGARALQKPVAGGAGGAEARGALEIHLRREEAPAGREENHGRGPVASIEWRGVSLSGDPFRSFAGGDGLRLSLAAKIIRAHGGETEAGEGALRVRLPLSEGQS